MRSHYDILNVSPTATKQEIKKAFHKLSLLHHPDLNRSKNSNSHVSQHNDILYKQISSAYTILSDDVQRQKYDLELDDWQRFGQHRQRRNNNGPSAYYNNYRGNNHHHTHTHHHGHNGSSAYTSNFHRILDGIYKPKNMIIGLTLGFLTVSTIKSIFNIERHTIPHSEKKHIVGDGKKQLVEAWKNPKTGQWEQPAPWSKTFQELKPEIHLIPRSQVVRSSSSASSSSKNQ